MTHSLKNPKEKNKLRKMEIFLEKPFCIECWPEIMRELLTSAEDIAGVPSHITRVIYF